MCRQTKLKMAVCGMFALALTGGNRAHAADPSRGEQIFQRCTACHSVETGKQNAIGPNLAGVVGRKAGSLPGYRYSTAMAKASFKWDVKTLDAFLANPQAFIKGTKMAAPPLSSSRDREDVIGFLSINK